MEKFSSPASIMIQFSDSFSQELDENTLEQTQDLQYAVVISEKLEDKVPTIGRNLWIGHLTYFSNDLFSELSISVPGIKMIQTALGQLFSLGDTLDLSEETIKKARTLRDLLEKDISIS